MGKTLIHIKTKNGKVLASPIPVTIALYFMMFAYAVSNTLIGPLVIVFIKQYAISLSANGLITLFQGVGGILFLIIGIFYGDKLLKPTWIIITFFSYCVAMTLLAFVSAYYQILILFFIIGANTRMLDAMMNAYVAEIHMEKRAFFLNILHACYGAGALIGPILSSFFISQNIQINFMFLGLGMFCLLIFAFFLYINKHSRIVSIRSEARTIRTVIKLIKNRNLLIMCTMAFLYVGYALGLSTWLPAFMVQEMHTDVIFSGLVVSALWSGIVTGRISHSFLSLRYKKRNLIIFGNLIGGTAILSAILINNPIAYIFGLFISAFFISAIMPLTMAMTGELFLQQTGSASSIIMLGATMGLMIVPWMIGLVAENVDFWAAILIVGLFSYLISILAVFLQAGREAPPKK